MDNEDDVIPEVMKPMFETSQRYLTDAEIKNQKQADFNAAWKDKAISIEAADQFLDAHNKTGMFLMYWDQDANSQICYQALTCGKTKADHVMANMLRRIIERQIGPI